ncbi:MAG TPA: hypothetical protein VE869_12160 [Gemmatimonas sp.]|nr:hypothetical protein [Gemmatimonas sp.]
MFPAVAGLLAATAATAAADQPLFTWTGTVDREVYLVLRGRNVETRGLDARLPNSARVTGSIPRNAQRGDVQVRLENGRGVASVIEQPTARNNYQTVVRIQDPSGGSDRYRVVAYWTGDENDGRGGNGGWDDRDDRNRDDRNRDDRNRDDRDRDNRGRGNGRDGKFDDRDNRGNDRNNGRGNGNGRNDRNNRGNNGGYDDGYGRPNGGSNREGPGTLSWSGDVDAIVDISIRGANVNYRTLSGATVTNVRSRLSGGALPQRDGQIVSIVNGNGRGSVQVVQQPSRSNGYTAIIRVSDPRGGAAAYNFDARW